MSLRAKFRMETLVTTTYPGGSKSHEVKLRPVYSSDPASENHQYWQATPAGLLEMSGLKDEAVAQLEPGKEYYLDISPAE